jgi:hypothetical protein
MGLSIFTSQTSQTLTDVAAYAKQHPDYYIDFVNNQNNIRVLWLQEQGIALKINKDDTIQSFDVSGGTNSQLPDDPMHVVNIANGGTFKFKQNGLVNNTRVEAGVTQDESFLPLVYYTIDGKPYTFAFHKPVPGTVRREPGTPTAVNAYVTESRSATSPQSHGCGRTYNIDELAKNITPNSNDYLRPVSNNSLFKRDDIAGDKQVKAVSMLLSPRQKTHVYNLNGTFSGASINSEGMPEISPFRVETEPEATVDNQIQKLTAEAQLKAITATPEQMKRFGGNLNYSAFKITRLKTRAEVDNYVKTLKTNTKTDDKELVISTDAIQDIIAANAKTKPSLSTIDRGEAPVIKHHSGVIAAVVDETLPAT